MLYIFVKYLTRIGLRAYFKKMYITGIENIPFDKPVLFAANHTNALLDPVLIGSTLPETVHFLTRADVFTPATEGIFKQLNMYPIYRIRDGYHLLSRNEATFAKCFDVLKGNGNIIIFSEGDCEAEKQLRSLKKGTARMAFQALEDFDLDVHIVPTSFNYTNHSGFRADVMLHFGEAFSVKEFDEIRLQNKARGIKAFNKKLSEALKRELIHLDDLEHKPLLESLLDIQRSQFLAPALPIFLKKDQTRQHQEQQVANYINDLSINELDAIKQEVTLFSQQLQQNKLNALALGKKSNPITLFGLFLLFPIFLVFAGMNIFPLWVSNYLVKRKVKQELFISTFRCFVMIFLYFFLWLILSVIGIITFSYWGILWAVLTPITAYLALFYKDKLDFEVAKWRFNIFKNKEPELAKSLLQKQIQILHQLT